MFVQFITSLPVEEAEEVEATEEPKIAERLTGEDLDSSPFFYGGYGGYGHHHYHHRHRPYYGGYGGYRGYGGYGGYRNYGGYRGYGGYGYYGWSIFDVDHTNSTFIDTTTFILWTTLSHFIIAYIYFRMEYTVIKLI